MCNCGKNINVSAQYELPSAFQTAERTERLIAKANRKAAELAPSVEIDIDTRAMKKPMNGLFAGEVVLGRGLFEKSVAAEDHTVDDVVGVETIDGVTRFKRRVL